ncbi:ECs_2282 family putative zinc-binding protein [Enterobacter asburiae]|uniref:ECs_2282 family putative zinc-binding protein n=1 Tax=Enterobacter asburiae TaxID=61645 RepID=UPI003A4C6BB0
MREKCFGDWMAGTDIRHKALFMRLELTYLLSYPRESVTSPCASACAFIQSQNIPVSAGVFIRARRALSRHSPTARNRLLFNLPNSRKDIFMQTMRTVCPDCGSEMFNQPDDFDFETNFTGVSCADCGREITKDDVVNQATDTVKKQLDDMLRNSLKGTGWKFD